MALYKNIALGFPLLPGVSEDVWTIESKISLKPVRGGAVEVVLALPEPDAGWVSLDDHFASSGFHFSVKEQNGHRRAHWTRESMERATTLFYKTQVYRMKEVDLRDRVVPKLEPPYLTRVNADVMQKVVESLKKKSSTPGEFARLLFESVNQQQPDQDMSFLLSSYGGVHMDVVMDVLAYAEVSAQLIKGIFLLSLIHI